MKIFKDLALAFIAALSLMMSACTGASDKSSEKEKEDEKVCCPYYTDSIFEVSLLEDNISYSSCLDCNILDDKKMEVWGPNFTCKCARRPVVMFVPCKEDIPVTDFVRPLVENGFVVAVPRCANIISTENKTRTTEGLRCGINDLTDAIKKVKLNYEKYGVDTTKIFVGGFGSGADIALHYCFVTNLYKDIDMEGVRGVIACAPFMSINFDYFDKNDDEKLKALIVISAEARAEKTEAIRLLKNQLQDQLTVNTVPVAFTGTTVGLPDSFRVSSKKFVKELLGE